MQTFPSPLSPNIDIWADDRKSKSENRNRASWQQRIHTRLWQYSLFEWNTREWKRVVSTRVALVTRVVLFTRYSYSPGGGGQHSYSYSYSYSKICRAQHSYSYSYSRIRISSTRVSSRIRVENLSPHRSVCGSKWHKNMSFDKDRTLNFCISARSNPALSRQL